eukprot:scaffold2100_cov114-Skeletonema_marinoi.AAC.3
MVTHILGSNCPWIVSRFNHYIITEFTLYLNAKKESASGTSCHCGRWAIGSLSCEVGICIVFCRISQRVSVKRLDDKYAKKA